MTPDREQCVALFRRLDSVARADLLAYSLPRIHAQLCLEAAGVGRRHAAPSYEDLPPLPDAGPSLVPEVADEPVVVEATHDPEDRPLCCHLTGELRVIEPPGVLDRAG